MSVCLLEGDFASEVAGIRKPAGLTFIGIREHGRLLALRCDVHNIVHVWPQSILREPSTLVTVFGDYWLRHAFPTFEQVDTQEGVVTVATGFDACAAFAWILDQCFLAAGYVPPGEMKR